jgi:sugar lactone lactonase YvrE
MKHSFATGQSTVLPIGRAEVFFDGVFSEPRLQHPEGIAIGPDGWIWCGTENGEILRIAPDSSRIELAARAGGFTLGLAFEGDRALFFCDNKDKAVYRLDLASHRVARFSPSGIRIPNYPVVDFRRHRLLVSDSYDFAKPGPGVWAYDLATGAGELWCGAPMTFANGMALAPSSDALFVCETFARRIARIAIDDGGAAAGMSIFASDLPGLPDGIAFDAGGSLFVGCYEPSRILRIAADGEKTEVYIEDATAHLLAHPTNVAFDGSALFAANLGRWHVTRIAADTTAPPLWRTVREGQT